MTSPNYIVYHAADLDGKGSAAIALRALRASECRCADDAPILIPMDYNWPDDPIDAIPDGACVHMLDFSLPPKSMRRLDARCLLVWIDHHTPRIREILAGGPLPNAIIHTADHSPSACLLTWRHFHPHQAAPSVVMHINEWDTATERTGNRWDTVVRPLQFGLRSYGLDPDNDLWNILLNVRYVTARSAADELVRGICWEGLAICRYIDQDDRQAVLSSSYPVHCRLDATGCFAPSAEFPDPGQTILTHALAINRNPFDPHILASHPLNATLPAELLLAWGYDPLARGWRLHVSPGPGALPTLDAGRLCRKLWNGGGHPGRAGATLPELPAWLLPGRTAEDQA